MLPGLTRTAAQPASIAAKTYLGWKWMSAMTGICDLLRDLGQRVGVVLADGTATRTMSQPAAVSSAICCRVALTSEVSVVAIDCTEIRRVAADGDRADLIWRRLARRGEHGRVLGLTGGADGHAKRSMLRWSHAPLSASAGGRAGGDRDAAAQLSVIGLTMSA